MATEIVTTAKTSFDLAEDLECEIEKAIAVFELVFEEAHGDARAQAAFLGALKLLKGCEADARTLRKAIDTERSALA